MADSPDSAASILAPPDPTAIPPNLAAVPPSGDQPTALPPTIAAPAAGSDMPTPMGSSPGTELPPDPDAERQVHEAWWRRALDKVGTILGGDQTVHITKDADGNVTMTHDASTTGEKWGRIAQAALVGAASGIQNSQGPGGLARAGAAGVQTGAQLPQQREQQAQQQVDFDNKQMMEKAQRMFVTQKGLELAAQAKRENLQHAQESAQALNDNYDLIDQSPNSENLGSIDLSDPMAIPNAAKKSPAAYDAYFHKGNKRFRFAVGPDNNVNLFVTDRNWEEQMNDTPTKVSDVDTNDAGKPVLKSKIVPPNTDRNGKLYTHSTAARNTYFSQLKTWSDAENADSKANKPDKVDTPKTLAEYNLAIAKATDPKEIAQLTQARDTTFKQEMQLRGREEGGPGGGPGSAAPKTPQEQQQFLSSLNPSDAAQVRAIGEIRNAPPTRYSKEGSRIMGLVDQAYPDYDSTNYQNYAKTKLDYAPSGQTGKGLNFIGTALAHMDRMEGNVDALHNVSIPVVGSWYNAVKNAAQKGTSPEIKAFVDDQKAVTSEIARAYNGGAITQGERDHMMDLISTSDSPDAIRGSLQEFRELLHGKLDQYQIGWDAQMPRSQRNAVLDNLQARGTAYRPAPPSAQQQEKPNPPPQKLTPNAPIFDARIYAHVHPEKDINDAVKRAKQKGMNVINAPQ